MVSQGLRAGVPTQVHQHNRHTILGGGGSTPGRMCVWEWGTWEISVPLLPFHCEPKTHLENSYLKTFF